MDGRIGSPRVHVPRLQPHVHAPRLQPPRVSPQARGAPAALAQQHATKACSPGAHADAQASSTWPAACAAPASPESSCLSAASSAAAGPLGSPSPRSTTASAGCWLAAAAALSGAGSACEAGSTIGLLPSAAPPTSSPSSRARLCDVRAAKSSPTAQGFAANGSKKPAARAWHVNCA